MCHDLCPTLAVYSIRELSNLLLGDIIFERYDDFLGCASQLMKNRHWT